MLWPSHSAQNISECVVSVCVCVCPRIIVMKSCLANKSLPNGMLERTPNRTSWQALEGRCVSSFAYVVVTLYVWLWVSFRVNLMKPGVGSWNWDVERDFLKICQIFFFNLGSKIILTWNVYKNCQITPSSPASKTQQYGLILLLS